MNPSIKLHIVRGPHTGTSSADFRGDFAVGHNESDEHRTVFEIKNASEGMITEALEIGPRINQFFQDAVAVEPDAFSQIATVLGLGGEGKPFARIGVWTPGHDEPTNPPV